MKSRARSYKMILLLLPAYYTCICQVFPIHYGDSTFYLRTPCQTVDRVYYKDERLNLEIDTCFKEKEISVLKDGKYIIYSGSKKRSSDNRVEKAIEVKAGKYNRLQTFYLHNGRFSNEVYHVIYEVYKMGLGITQKEIQGDTLKEHRIAYSSRAQNCNMENASPVYRLDQTQNITNDFKKEFHLDSVIEFWDTKHIKAVSYYKNCLKTGRWLYWAKGGQLMGSQEYFKGKPIGIWRSWNYGGGITQIIKHKNGEVKEKTTLFSQYGNEWIEKEKFYRNKTVKIIYDFRNNLTETEKTFFKDHRTKKGKKNWTQEYIYDEKTLKIKIKK